MSFIAKVILICGKIASGKSYYAKQLSEKENTVILNTDELTYALFDNEQGKSYAERASRANRYLMKKAAEIAEIGCNVILDWGFWTAKERDKTEKYFRSRNIKTEWHYIDIDDISWDMNIRDRNEKVRKGSGGSDFYVTEALKNKVLSLFEIPSEEIDVWYTLNRQNKN